MNKSKREGKKGREGKKSLNASLRFWRLNILQGFILAHGQNSKVRGRMILVLIMIEAHYSPDALVLQPRPLRMLSQTSPRPLKTLDVRCERHILSGAFLAHLISLPLSWLL